MKFKELLLLFASTSTFLFANMTYTKNQDCKECHPKIYEEYQSSMHAKATIYKDPIHRAVWEKHPLSKKQKQYRCGKCHIPTADNLSDMLQKGKSAMPDPENETHNEAISCSYCHKIKTVEEGFMSNTNVMNESEYKDYYGTRDDPKRTRAHYSFYNEEFKNGKMCMGCHSHKKNKAKLDVCVTDIGKEDSKQTCISCHMPHVQGSMSTKHDTDTYAFHGFPGANVYKDMLVKYIHVDLKKQEKSFSITIHTEAPHNLMLHPLRDTRLYVSVERDGKIEELETQFFTRTIGSKNKPTPPWLAEEIIKDTMIKGKENRVIAYDRSLKVGDKVKVKLGYYLVNQKAMKKFDMEPTDHITTFHILKEAVYTIQEKGNTVE